MVMFMCHDMWYSTKALFHINRSHSLLLRLDHPLLQISQLSSLLHIISYHHPSQPLALPAPSSLLPPSSPPPISSPSPSHTVVQSSDVEISLSESGQGTLPLTQYSQISRMVTRAQDGIVKPNPKYIMNSTLQTNALEPSSYKQAAQHLEWQAAMASEFHALISSGTWVLVPPSPAMNILPNKWIFRVKRHADGTIEQ